MNHIFVDAEVRTVTIYVAHGIPPTVSVLIYGTKVLAWPVEPMPVLAFATGHVCISVAEVDAVALPRVYTSHRI